MNPIDFQKFDFAKFAEWPCKAKFKFVKPDRFVEFFEIENSPLSKTDPYAKANLTVIKDVFVDTDGHIKLDFQVEKNKDFTDEKINTIYNAFLLLILSTVDLIESEFIVAKIPVPKVEIVLMNAIDVIVNQVDRKFLEGRISRLLNKKIVI